LKLALIYAVLDGASQIDLPHFEAAVAVMDYCQESARWVFGKATGDKLANTILWELRRRKDTGMTRTEISNSVCYRNTPETKLNLSFTQLVQNNLAKVVTEKNQNGQNIERWFAIT